MVLSLRTTVPQPQLIPLPPIRKPWWRLLHQAIRSHGLTNAEVAARMQEIGTGYDDWTDNTVSRWATGKQGVDLDIIADFERALGLREGTLQEPAMRGSRWERIKNDLETDGDSFLVTAEPGIKELLSEIVVLDNEKARRLAAQQLRTLRDELRAQEARAERPSTRRPA